MNVAPWTGLALALLLASDAGDPEATDRRLERAGAGAGLRFQVHEAVARAATFLENAQRPDGLFLAPGTANRFAGAETLPVDALCAMALESSGSPRSRAAAGRAFDRLAPGPGRIPGAVRGSLLTASLLARLSVERRADPRIAADFGAALADLQDRGTGLWVLRGPRPGVDFGTLVQPADAPTRPDVDAAHAALLGLAAAESAGWRAPLATWRRCGSAIHRLQGAEGGWRFNVRAAVSDLSSTSHALAGLFLVREAVERRGLRPEEDGEPLARGRAHLLEEAADALWIERTFPGGAPGKPRLLHDLAEALSFAGIPDVDGTPAYEAVASVLLACQARDGRWASGSTPTDDLVETSFAVLALTRASETLRRDPGPAAAPRRAPAWPEDGAPPPAANVPAEDAREALDLLEALLRDPRADGAALRRTLLFVGRAAASPPDDGWAVRAEAVFLRALPGPEGVLAAGLLGRAHPRVSAPLRRALGDDRLPLPVLREGFLALARLGDPASVTWLCGENLSPDDRGPRFDRARAALRAIPRFAGVPGGIRRACAERILKVYEGIESAASPYVLVTTAKFDPTDRSRWVACRRFVLDALLALSGEVPGVVTLKAYRQWLGDHADPRKAPWADR